MSYMPNEIYSVDESVTEVIGTREFRKTNKLSDIYNTAQPFDTSIAFAEVDSSIVNKIVKTPYAMSNKTGTSNEWTIYELPDSVFDCYKFNGATPLEPYKKSISVQPYSAICYCSSGNAVAYYTDKSGIKVNTDRYIDSLRFIIDYPINELIFKVNLTGYTYAQIQSLFDKINMTNKPAANKINFKDFCQNPSDYYISSYSISCYCWDNSADKWVLKSNIKPCHVYNDESDKGISGVTIKNNFPMCDLSKNSFFKRYDLCTFTSGGTSWDYMTNHYKNNYMISDDFDIVLTPYGDMPATGTTEDYGWCNYYQTSSTLFLEWHTGKSNNLDPPDQRFESYAISLYPLSLGVFLYNYLASFGVYMIDENANLNMYARKPRTLYLYKDTFLGKLKDGKSIGAFVDSNHIPAYKEWNRNSSTCVREYNEIVDEETWIINDNQIPTKSYFNDNLCITDVPLLMWKIKDNIPYKDCFPDLKTFDDSPWSLWIIGGNKNDDIPRKPCFIPSYIPRKEKKLKYKSFQIVLYDYCETIPIEKGVRQ